MSLDSTLSAVREQYDASVDAKTELASVTDACFDAVHQVMEEHGWPFCGDDRAENLVSAIARYLLECRKS